MKLFALENLIAKNDVVAVALSGGKDSQALLHALISLKKEKNFTVKAINVDHGIRENSESDSEFCKAQAQKYKIEILCFSVDAVTYAKENKLSLEESARHLRYDCFKKAIADGFCDKIATAHHKSDQAETVLFNLFRGSSLKGAGGIKEKNDDNRVIRPLLHTSQKEIEDYISFYSIPFVTDETNFSTDFSRNFIRLEVLPLIEKRFPSATENIASFSHLTKADDEFLYRLAEKELIFDGDKIKISVNLEKPILSRAILLSLKALGVLKDYTKTHIEDCEKLCLNQTGAKVVLPKNLVAIKEYDYIVFYKEKEKTAVFKDFSLGEFITDEFTINFEKISLSDFKKEKKQAYKSINGDTFSPITLYADADIFEGSTLQHPTDGDVFEKFGGGKKTLNKYLIDKKIPKSVREKLIIVKKDGNILAVLGVEISNLVKITDSTHSILKIKCEKRR